MGGPLNWGLLNSREMLGYCGSPLLSAVMYNRSHFLVCKYPHLHDTSGPDWTDVAIETI